MHTPAQSNTEATTTEAPVTKPVTKMDQCKKIYDEVFAPGYDLKGKSQRAVFIARVMDELQSTKNLANTYYQNISNSRRGKGLYKYNKYESKKGTPDVKPQAEGLDLPGANAPTRALVEDAEKQTLATAKDLTQRWQVKNEDGKVIDSFSSRDKAKKAVNERGEGFTWADRDAK